jgi:hypothetical protein
MPQAAATTVKMMMGVLARARELEAADEADMASWGYELSRGRKGMMVAYGAEILIAVCVETS